ncbi:redoxin domain-containing protein [Patescibacteria group bacterium]|nr:redoxin domain-containing protein [Patescibacteria group bacterium]
MVDYNSYFGYDSLMLTITDHLPSLTLDILERGKFVTKNLDDYRGKWLILLFYPADFSFICPTELQEAQQEYEEFKKLGAEIASVSTDTKYVHKAWHDTSPMIKTVEYPMVADPAGILCRMMGVYIEEEGMARRASYVIDPEGVIVAMDIHSNDIGRNIQEIKRKLQAAIYVREHGGEVCPANWKPGQKTMRPGEELVGKI